MRDIWLLWLRALVARARGDEAAYRERIVIARWQIAWLRRTHRDGQFDGVRVRRPSGQPVPGIVRAVQMNPPAMHPNPHTDTPRTGAAPAR